MLGDLFQTIGSIFSTKMANDQAKYLAKNAVSMRVADAKKAGIHPLAALGATINTPTPHPLIGDSAGQGLKSLGDMLSGRQDLERRRVEADIRRTNAETDLTRARSRTIISGARTEARNPRMPGSPDRTYWTPFGRIRAHPDQTPAQYWQDEFGDISENVAGTAVNVPASLYWTWFGRPNRVARIRSDVRAARRRVQFRRRRPYQEWRFVR